MYLLISSTLWLVLTQWTNIVNENSNLGKILFAPLAFALCCVCGFAGVMMLFERFKDGLSLDLLYKNPFENFGIFFFSLLMLAAPLTYLVMGFESIKEWVEEWFEERKENK